MGEGGGGGSEHLGKLQGHVALINPGTNCLKSIRTQKTHTREIHCNIVHVHFLASVNVISSVLHDAA